MKIVQKVPIAPGVGVDNYNNQQGATPAPVVALTGNGNAITNGDVTPDVSDDTDFGSTAKAATVTKTYTISNTGDADLTITAISVPAGYTLTDPALPITIASGNSDTFSVRFDATAYETYAGNVTISSDELDDFVFAITAVATYALTVLATSPLRYNKLNEGSGSAIVDSSGNGYTGTYTGVTWDGTLSPFGETVPFFDAVNDDANIYSASFASAFNLDEGAVLIWIKMSALSVWTDGATRVFVRLQRDGNNVINIRKASTNNRLIVARTGNATLNNVIVDSLSYTDWFSLMLSWSVADDELRAYINGIQVGTTQTGVVASAGSGLSSAATIFGSDTTAHSQVHHGYLAQAKIWNRPADADMIALGVPA